MAVCWEDVSTVWEELKRPHGGTIVYLIIDGVGGLPDERYGGTELEVARSPHLDRLASESSCGLLEMVGPGITPGSGPGHLSLFGYHPLLYRVGRGVLSAMGIGFDLQPGDVAARVNFATVDGHGVVTDRRAGRIDTATNERLCRLISQSVHLDFDGGFFIRPVKEHRALLVLRGPGLCGRLQDTDPQTTGQPPRELRALDEDSRPTAALVSSFLRQVQETLRDEERANMVLLRGFDTYRPFPSLEERFGLRGRCIAQYPMYRGVSRLVGMEVHEPPVELSHYPTVLKEGYGDYDLHFLHVKPTDSRGEDGDFPAKVRVIEQVDGMIPGLLDVDPDVLVVTADHSTPAVMAGHSWHPVPVLLRARYARRDSVTAFNETACAQGSLGLRPALHLMGLALAHAGRLEKCGA